MSDARAPEGVRAPAPGRSSRDAVEVTFRWNGVAHACRAGTSVAAALLNAGARAFRLTSSGAARAPLCGMGVCHECRVTVDGRRHVRACMIDVTDGMEIHADAAN